MPARNPFHKRSRSAFKRRRTNGRGLEPIPGSITYGGQPRTKLTKSPGSAFPHDFIDQYGRQVEETYMIQPDRSLIIAHRQYKPIRFFGD
ncbi:hypothetical protein Rleg5DRAFT_5071 [Rhizobium leguminosarum bv. viciae WSM1455]|uniref:hypothetical protein n=1 Tax=Rhizobium acaciae TaxID=2989736 RepID=UPI00027D6F77|nr:hypothetical protein [Rhizobium acaciae]EJC69283.1 hypothetical protein Rleg5DRAFT_5071 [Rhizobium leguminosarum bv. viciae WSM1455]